MRYLRWILIEENSEQQFLKIWDLKSPLSLKVAYCFNFKYWENWFSDFGLESEAADHSGI